MLRSISSLALVLLLTAGALAHGGIYNVPPDAQPGGEAAGGTVAPPTNPGGGAAPRPGVAGTAGPRGTAGARGTGRDGMKRGNTVRATISGGQLDADPGLDRWEFWWEQNKDRFLALREQLGAGGLTSGGIAGLTGRGRRVTGRSSRPDQAVVDDLVAPALIEVLAGTREADLADSIVLALARMASDRTRDAILTAIVGQLDHPALSVQSSTVLALGVLGAPEAEEVLRHVAIDDSRGRQLVGADRVPSLVRAFGALSLGLLATPESGAILVNLARELPDSETDVKVCAVVGLGLLGPSHPQARDAIACLRDLLGDRRLDPTIASYVPTALSRLSAREALPDLVAGFVDRDASHSVRQSIAIALGGLASPGDEGFESLKAALAEAKDAQTRHFALMSLAEITVRAAQSGEVYEIDPMLEVLERELDGKGRSRNHRSWAALATALCAGADGRFGAALQERVRLGFTKENDPSLRSAYAMALGLMSDRGMADAVDASFRETREPGYQGYAAVALGLLRHFPIADTLRQLCASKITSPSLRLSAATGLGLMGDVESIATLVEAMQAAETLGTVSSIARALALVGDTRAVDPLLSVARDAGRPAVTRGFACVSLGLLCERTDLPFNARIRADNNYRAQVPAIAEVLDIL